MAITKKKINSISWIAITSAGKSGSCWLGKNIKGKGKVYINHSDSGSPPVKTFGYPLSKPIDNNGMLKIGANNLDDIFYARCQESNNEVIIFVDVI